MKMCHIQYEVQDKVPQGGPGVGTLYLYVSAYTNLEYQNGIRRNTFCLLTQEQRYPFFYLSLLLNALTLFMLCLHHLHLTYERIVAVTIRADSLLDSTITLSNILPPPPTNVNVI